MEVYREGGSISPAAEATSSAPTMFSIGICATGRSPRLIELLDIMRTETFPSGFELARVVIVASACGDGVLRQLRRIALREQTIRLIEQRERKGKADAINEIIRTHVGKFVVFVNADALPAQGAISNLLANIQRDPETGIMSGSPVIGLGEGVTHDVLALMWDTHDVCSQNLNDLHLSNHCTDELMVVRSDALEELPMGIVNDGAFMGGKAFARGYHIRYLEDAPVRVDVPQRLIDVIRQRRRIIYGHLQVWRILGRAPKTAESLVVLSPRLGFTLVVRTLSRRPRLILALPVALICEGMSLLGAVVDSFGPPKKHAVWDRYGD